MKRRNPKFIKGLILNKMFYKQIVAPLMRTHFPKLKYSAGLVGHGSDVFGFDSPRSTDHDWGPRLHLFFTEKDYKEYKDQVDHMLRENLPVTFKGFSTNFSNEQEGYLKHIPINIKKGPVNHLFSFWTVESFFHHYLAFDPNKDPSFKEWLTFPQQALLELTSGEVFRDEVGLQKVRKKFKYYPHSVWVYMYFRQWGEIGDLEPFMGRTGESGDELGSNIIATKIVDRIMRLCFLMEKKYIPFYKWFGTAFSHLKSAKTLEPYLMNVVHGTTWVERENNLAKAYITIAKMHNMLKFTKPIKVKTENFAGRPYRVINAYNVYTKIYEEYIKRRKNLSIITRMKYHIGAIDQFLDFVQLNRLKYVYTKFKAVIQ